MRAPAHSIVLALAVVVSAPVMGQWSTATLSQWRLSLAATTVGDKAIFGGGASCNFTNCNWPYERDNVDIYNDSTGGWSTATLTEARWNLAATAVGTKALFAGGVSDWGTPLLDVVDVYDDATGTWSTASLSQARAGLAATTVGTKAIFAGGGGDIYGGFFSDVVDVYDGATGAWSSTSLSQGREYLVATTVGTKAIFAGGENASGASDAVDIYDDASGTWSTATLSQPRLWLAATTVGTKAMFGGGQPGSGASDVVDIYDDASGTWSTATLSQPRLWLAATTVGTKAMCAGGLHPSGYLFDVVDIYDAAGGTWSTDVLSEARCLLAATAVGTKALFGGGFGGPLPSSEMVDIYDDALGTSYCGPAVANSTGFAATIVSQGYPGSVAQGYAILTANQVPDGEFGYFLTSQTQGFFMPPGSDGFICLGGNIGRYNGNVGQGPSFTLQIDLTSMPVNPPVAVQPGDTYGFQAWYRDLGSTNNFTDAVSVTFQ